MTGSSNKARTRSLHDSDYARFIETMIERRDAAGLTQRNVATALGWNQSLLSKIETRQRRMDVIEFIRIASVIGTSAADVVRQFESTLAVPASSNSTKARRS